MVAGDDTVSVTTGTGDDRETETGHHRRPAPVPAALRRCGCPRLARGTRCVDYAGYATARGAPGDAVHPWAAAGLHPYTWVAGGPPAGPGQLVLTAPTRLTARASGSTVQTAAGRAGSRSAA